jgi:hypothetical protein
MAPKACAHINLLSFRSRENGSRSGDFNYRACRLLSRGEASPIVARPHAKWRSGQKTVPTSKSPASCRARTEFLDYRRNLFLHSLNCRMTLFQRS